MVRSYEIKSLKKYSVHLFLMIHQLALLNAEISR